MKKRFLASLLAVTFMLMLLPVSATAAEEDGQAPVITAFAALEESSFDVVSGTPYGEITAGLGEDYPSVTATVDGGETEIAVFWSSADYHADEGGTYTFTAQNASGVEYALADGVEWPSVSVTLAEMIPLADNVAEVNGENCSSLPETLAKAVAIANAGQTVDIKLLDNITGTEGQYIDIPSGMTAVVDLNGFALTGVNSDSFIKNNGNLTICDSSNGSGRIYTTNTTNQSRHAIENYGTLAIYGGTFGDSDTDRTNANSVQRGNALRNFGTATIYGGFFTACDNYTNGGFAYAIANGHANHPDAKLTIVNATVYGNCNGLIAADGGTLTVKGGTYTLGAGTQTNLFYMAYASGSGVINIEGGSFTRSVHNTYGFLYTQDTQSEINITGGTYEDTEAGQTVIAGGSGTVTISEKNGVAAPALDGISATGSVTVQVSGGSFGSEVPQNCCASGFESKDNGDGSYGVKLAAESVEVWSGSSLLGTFPSLAAAFAAVTDASCTVKLASDVTVDGELTLPNQLAVNLDLNGHTIYGSGKLTVPDSLSLYIKGQGDVHPSIEINDAYVDINNTGTYYGPITNSGTISMSLTGTTTFENTITGKVSSSYGVGCKFAKSAGYTVDNVWGRIHPAGCEAVETDQYIVLTPITYTIVLHLNGGTLGDGDTTGGTQNETDGTVTVSYPYGSSTDKISIPIKANFTKADYIFGGWYYDEGCTSTAANSTQGSIRASSITSKSDDTHTLHLYANWTLDAAAQVSYTNEEGEMVSNSYLTLADAVAAANAANTATIKMLKDVSFDDAPYTLSGSGITLDLNGHTINGNEPSNANKVLLVTGALTIDDTSNGKSGKLTTHDTGTQPRVISLEGTGTLTLKNGTISTDGTAKTASAVYVSSDCSFTQEGGTVSAVNASSIGVNCKGGTSSFTMTGGTITAPNGTGVAGVSSAPIAISSGTVIAKDAIAAGYSATQITGGDFTGTVAVKSGTVSGGTFHGMELEPKYVAASYAGIYNNADTTIGKAPDTYAAVITTAGGGKLYYTEAGGGNAAITKAANGDTVTLCESADANKTLAKDATLTIVLETNGAYTGTLSANTGCEILTETVTNGTRYTAAVTETSAEAKIVHADGTATYCATLAIANSTVKAGEMIILLKNVDLASQLRITRNITLDLGGHTINSAALININGSPTAPTVTIQNGRINSTTGGIAITKGDLTVKNLTIDTTSGTGAGVSLSSSSANFTMDEGSSIVSSGTGVMQSSGTFEMKTGSSISSAGTGVHLKAGTFTLGANASVSSSEVGIFTLGQSTTYVYGTVQSSSTQYAAIQGNGTDTTAPGTTINIYPGAVVEQTSGHGAGIYHPQVGTLNISGGTISGYSGIGIKSGTLNITGGTITGTGAYQDAVSSTNGIKIDGSAIMVDSYIGYAGAMNINISGENTTLTSAHAYAIHEIGSEASQTNVVKLDITSGNFTGASDKDAILVRDVAASIVSVTGGYYEPGVNEAYVVDGYGAVDSNKSGYTHMIGQEYTATFTVTPSNAAVKVVDSKGNEVTPNVDGSYTLNSASSYTYTVSAPGYPAKSSTIASGSANDQQIPVALSQSPSSTSTGSSGGSSSGSSGYTVTITKPSNGTVTASDRKAGKGDTVTLTVKPNSGYALDDLTVTDRRGNSVKLTDRGNGKFAFTMPSGAVTVQAAFARIPEQSDVTFADVSNGAYYRGAVVWAVGNGITGGTTATTFSPDAPCTRAQAVTFLWRASGSPAPRSSVNPFTDVQSGAYYYDAVLWAVENGITTGTTATTFSPDVTVTRCQAVTFQHRAAGSPAAGITNTFTDVAASAYYVNAVRWAVENGVTNGATATTFRPDAPCTRAQIVTFLYRAGA